MGVFAGPTNSWLNKSSENSLNGLVTDGLVLALDAGRTLSYSGSGTTWTDLSDNSNNVTLTNGPTFSSDNFGAIVFDGTNDYAVTSTSITPSGTNSFTYSAWIYIDTIGGSFGTSIKGAVLFSGDGFGRAELVLKTDTNTAGPPDRITFTRYGGSTTGSCNVEVDMSVGVWYNITLVRDGASSQKVYQNGFEIGTGNVSNSFTADKLKIGAAPSQSSFSGHFDGKMSNILYYDRALTAAEVLQNFNTLRGRYNVALVEPEEELYSFTSAFFTVSRALTDSPTSDTHRFGPTQTQVRAWLSGSSNGGGSHSWANTYVDCPQDGYQRWTIPKSGTYRITAKGGGSGHTDSPDDYMLGVKVIADFNLTGGEKLILAAGQGVPDYDGDHCNGGGGASWVMSGNDYTTAIPLIVANGAGGDTSDGTAKGQANVTLGNSITVTPTSGEGGGSAVTGKQTTPINSNATAGRGSQNTSQPNSGGWLSDGGDAGESVSVGGHGFRSDLKGGIRNNNTAGNGGFGGGSGGEDESGSAGGGFTGAYGTDNNNITGHGSSFVNDDNEGNVSVALAQATTTFQNTDYTSEDQYQGWIKIEFIS